MRARHMRTGRILTLTAGLVVGLATIVAGAPNGNHPAHVKQVLSPTAPGSSARGKLVLVVKRNGGKLDVGVRKLAAASHFEVLIDGVKVGDLDTNGGGNGHARFGTKPRGRAKVLGIDPRGKHVLVRDDGGNDVLEADCPKDTQDAGKVACCVYPDDAMRAARNGDDEGDDDPKCQMLSPEDCDAAYGDSAGGSCLPDPCSSVSPVPDGTACCIPDSDDEDGEGAECDDLTPDDCSAEGGTMISATSCDPNPCEPTPPADPRVVCCTGDGNLTCGHSTASACTAAQGVDLGAGSCDPNPCEDLSDDPGDDPGDAPLRVRTSH